MRLCGDREVAWGEVWMGWEILVGASSLFEWGNAAIWQVERTLCSDEGEISFREAFMDSQGKEQSILGRPELDSRKTCLLNYGIWISIPD